MFYIGESIGCPNECFISVNPLVGQMNVYIGESIGWPNECFMSVNPLVGLMNVYIGESIGRRTSAETHVHLLRNHQTTQ
jgi:hypothetical protein